MPPNPDPIRDLCQTQARRLGLSAYAIAKAAGVGEDVVRRYLTGQTSMSSHHLAAILPVLDIAVRPRSRRPKIPPPIV